jgi:hypothetical protein
MEAAKLHRVVAKSHSRFNSPVQGCGGHHVFIANIHPRTKVVTETFFMIFTSSSDEEGIPLTPGSKSTTERMFDGHPSI